MLISITGFGVTAIFLLIYAIRLIIIVMCMSTSLMRTLMSLAESESKRAVPNTASAIIR